MVINRTMFLAAHSRAARALLNWSQADLAKKANLSESTVRNFEKGRSDPYGRNLYAIEGALVAAGIEFIDAGETSLGGGIGVRVRVAQSYASMRTPPAQAAAAPRSPAKRSKR